MTYDILLLPFFIGGLICNFFESSGQMKQNKKTDKMALLSMQPENILFIADVKNPLGKALF